jgi:hypothetical protein
MPIHLVCQCGARVIAPTKRAGQSIRCPKCDARIAVPGESSATSTFSDPTRSSRLESAISDLVSARHTDAPAPRRIDRVDLPQEKLKPAPAAPAQVSASAARLQPVALPPASPKATPKLEPTPIIEPGPAPSVAPVPFAPASFAPVREPVFVPAMVDLKDPPEITVAAVEGPVTLLTSPAVSRPNSLPVMRPIRIVTASRGPRVDKSWLGAVYGLAALWSVLAMVGLIVAGLESYFYYRAEELWRLERWAFLVIAASAIQLSLAIYLIQIADWIACRAAAVVISCIAAFEAMILAVTLFSKSDGWFARFLDLAPHIQSNRALGVTLLLTLLSVLLAYTTASVSLAWQRAEQKGLAKRILG